MRQIEPIVKFLKVDKTGLSFEEYVVKASKQGIEDIGMTVLCVHTDADAESISVVYQNKISPARAALDREEDAELCRF